MLGQPDPVVPIRTPQGDAGRPRPEFGRTGFVSVWAATFGTIEAAEEYFGIPDEIGVYLPPDAFTTELGLKDVPADLLEVNFEQVEPRPLAELLLDASFSISFRDDAVAAAAAQGNLEAQGVALLYDFDYRLKPGWQSRSGPLSFVGAFPFLRIGPRSRFPRLAEISRDLGRSPGAIVYAIVALTELTKKRREERGDGTGQVSAREVCDHLLTCRGEDSRATLRELGLLRSEDVGKIIYAFVAAGLLRQNELDSEADFQGLFSLE
jgi:uncharacterized repeat protein (TIGR04138 family)